MASLSCQISPTSLVQLMDVLFTEGEAYVNITKSTMSLMLLTTPTNGSRRQRNVNEPLPLVQGTIQNGENNTWFKLTKNYQEVRIDE